MMRYRTIPKEVEAIKWEKGNLEDLIEFFGKLKNQEGLAIGNDEFTYYANKLFIHSENTSHPVAEGNYIVRLSNKTLKIMHQNHFEKNYQVCR